MFRGNSGEQGGGLLITRGAPTVANCEFAQNASANGGGLWVDGSSALVASCSFVGNSASNLGGAIYVRAAVSEASLAVVDCIFKANSSRLGGGVYSLDNDPLFERCDFEMNYATGEGGGLHSVSSSPTLRECDVANNLAGQGGGIFCSGPSYPELIGSVVCGNESGQIVGNWQDVQGNCIAISCDDCPGCLGDLDQDMSVTSADLGILIALWGTDGSLIIGSDINGDGIVGAADVGLLVAAWGGCS